MSNVFSEEDKKFIIENYPKMPTEELVKIIGYTERQIRGYAHNKGLRKNDRPNRLEDWQKEYIHKWYNKKGNGEIAHEIGLTTKQVNDYGYRKIGNVDVDRYSVCEDYFGCIDTEEKAYWLGFLYADGSLNENNTRGYVKSISLEVALSSKDVEHLNKFNTAIGSTYKIKDRKVLFNNKEYKASRLIISKTNFCRNLIDKKCIPNKSLVIEFPSEDIVPKHLVRHFIRGYFDGDGCICHSSEKSKTKGYIYGFVGTKSMIEGIQRILNDEIGATYVKITEKGKAFQTQWSGRDNCRRFYEYAYKDATIWLDRKYDKFNKIINKEV